jgi:beta-fructofuranosidase
VCSEPVDALVTARRARHEASAAAPVTVGAQFEIEARFASRAAAPTIRLRFSDSEHLDVVVDAAARDVTVDRSSASADTRAHGGYATILPPAGSSGELGLRIFVDGSIVEVFTSDGRCATLRFYPVAPPPWTVEVSAAAEHDEVTVWELAPTIAGPAAGGGR